MFFISGFLVLYHFAKRNAKLVQEEDKNLYEEKWETAKQNEARGLRWHHARDTSNITHHPKDHFVKSDNDFKPADVEEGNECKSDLEAIAKICKEMNEKLQKSLEHSVSELHWFRQIIYRIGAGGFKRYSKSGKIRQATKKIDDLFIEVVDLSQSAES